MPPLNVWTPFFAADLSSTTRGGEGKERFTERGLVVKAGKREDKCHSASTTFPSLSSSSAPPLPPPLPSSPLSRRIAGRPERRISEIAGRKMRVENPQNCQIFPDCRPSFQHFCPTPHHHHRRRPPPVPDSLTFVALISPLTRRGFPPLRGSVEINGRADLL